MGSGLSLFWLVQGDPLGCSHDPFLQQPVPPLPPYPTHLPDDLSSGMCQRDGQFYHPKVQLSASAPFNGTFQSHSQSAPVSWRLCDALQQGKTPFMPKCTPSSAGHLLSVQRARAVFGTSPLSLPLGTQSSVSDQCVVNSRYLSFLGPVQVISPGFIRTIHGQSRASFDWPLCSLQYS